MTLQPSSHGKSSTTRCVGPHVPNGWPYKPNDSVGQMLSCHLSTPLLTYPDVSSDAQGTLPEEK